MVCRNCGSAIPDGQLYCPFCGEEVQLVPEYSSVDMQRAKKRMEEEELAREQRRRELEAEEREKEKRMKPGTRILCAVLIAALTAGMTVCMHTMIERNNHANFGYLFTQAGRRRQSGDAAGALRYLVQAEAVMPDGSIELPLLKSDLLKELGQLENAEAVLYELLTANRSDIVYEKLFACLMEDGQNEEIASLLKNSGSEKLKEKYHEYLAEPPAMSLMNGNTYAYGTMLSLFADGEGSIFYTMDGTVPDESSTLYTEPILLAVGSNRISAIFINDKGIRSEAASAVFSVKEATASLA